MAARAETAKGAGTGAGAATMTGDQEDARGPAQGPQFERTGGAPRTGPCPGTGRTPETAAARRTGGRSGRLAGAEADHRETEQRGELTWRVNNVSIFLVSSFLPE